MANEEGVASSGTKTAAFVYMVESPSADDLFDGRTEGAIALGSSPPGGNPQPVSPRIEQGNIRPVPQSRSRRRRQAPPSDSDTTYQRPRQQRWTGDAAGSGRGGRFSVGRKRAVVLRLLRGEDLESVSRAVGITAARASQWRERFLAAGQASLKSRAPDARRQATTSHCRRGPVGAAPDDVLVGHIRRLLDASPFHGEGDRKAWRSSGSRASAPPRSGCAG